MPKHTTYSFVDATGALTHPILGAFSFEGKGIGDMTVDQAEANTVHDRAADGTIMVSKVAAFDGSLTINCQQTSSIHKWLLNGYNILLAMDASVWAQGSGMVRNVTTKDSHIFHGWSFQKKTSMPYQAQGSRVTWVLMCAEIISMNA